MKLLPNLDITLRAGAISALLLGLTATTFAAEPKKPAAPAVEAAAGAAAQTQPAEPETAEDAQKKKPFPVVPSLGISILGYSETGASDFSQTAVGVSLEFTRRLGKSRWEIGAEMHVPVLALAASREETTARSFAFNLGGGYQVTPEQAAWRVRIMAGLAYRTMWVTENRFGFSHLLWPELYPAVVRSFGQHEASLRLKVSPLSTGLSFGLDNHEYVIGAGWLHRLPSGKAVSGHLEFSELLADVADARVVSRTLTLSAAYHW